MYICLPRLCRSLLGHSLRSTLLVAVVLVCSAAVAAQPATPTLLKQYQWQIAGAISFMLVETSLIGFLLISRERQRRAEEGLRNALIEVEQLKEKLQQENIYLREQVVLEHEFQELIGNSEEIKYVLFKIQQVAPRSATSMAAQSIHLTISP